MKMRYLLNILLLCFSLNSILSQEKALPEGFVYVKEVIPDVILEMRYAGHNNFIGKPVKAYNKEVAILSKPAAKALFKVQQELKEEGYKLKIFDAYRPQTAVNHFIKWAKKEGDTLKKQEFYPEIDKGDLFKMGYIASKSGHSRGSTVDLTIVDSNTRQELDMGSNYDFFGDISHHETTKITAEQKANRKLLKQAMMKQGFVPYPEEWWHYTFIPEAFPDTYFNFKVE